jgi:hypothetical protein
MYVFDLDTKHYRPGLYRLSFSVSGSTPPYFVEFTVLHRHHTHEDTEEDDHGRGTGPRK